VPLLPFVVGMHPEVCPVMGYLDVLEEEEVSLTGSLMLEDKKLLPWNIIVNSVCDSTALCGFLDSALCEFLNC